MSKTKVSPTTKEILSSSGNYDGFAQSESSSDWASWVYLVRDLFVQLNLKVFTYKVGKRLNFYVLEAKKKKTKHVGSVAFVEHRIKRIAFARFNKRDKEVTFYLYPDMLEGQGQPYVIPLDSSLDRNKETLSFIYNLIEIVTEREGLSI